LKIYLKSQQKLVLWTSERFLCWQLLRIHQTRGRRIRNCFFWTHYIVFHDDMGQSAGMLVQAGSHCPSIVHINDEFRF
jgi:hypothetical protein